MPFVLAGPGPAWTGRGLEARRVPDLWLRWELAAGQALEDRTAPGPKRLSRALDDRLWTYGLRPRSAMWEESNCPWLKAVYAQVGASFL